MDPKSVDTVIISHYHGDHVNGLLRADNSLTFPNAEILVPAAEHKFWMDDGEMSRAPDRSAKAQNASAMTGALLIGSPWRGSCRFREPGNRVDDNGWQRSPEGTRGHADCPKSQC